MMTNEKDLATFPIHDPNPVLSTKLDGSPIYVNPTAVRMVAHLGVADIEKLLPSNHSEIVRSCFEQEQSYRAIVKRKSHVIGWIYTPVNAESIVHIYGHLSDVISQTGGALSQSEGGLRDIIDALSITVFFRCRFGVEGLQSVKLEFISQGAFELYGYAPGEVERNPALVFDAVRSEDLPEFEASLHTAVMRTQPWLHEFSITTKAGKIRWLRGNAVPKATSGGAIVWNGILIDITSHKEAEQQLQASEARYRTLYDDHPSMFFTLDADGSIVSVNRFGAQQLGYEVEELLGKPLWILMDQGQKSFCQMQLESCFQDSNTVHRWKTAKLRKDGALIWLGVSARVVSESYDQPTVLMVCEDITEAHYLSEQLTHQASHDALTGLSNRREFERRLQWALKTARTDKAEHALCYLDLDQFKIINDTCGHIAGDSLLRQLARLLQKQIRKHDLLARLGGDEFGILMEYCTLDETRRVADGLRKSIEEFKFVWEDRTFSIGASIGLVPINETCESITGLLSAADAACYEAKDAGRNRVHEYHENDTVMVRRHGQMQWVVRIDQALQNDRFLLYCQPIVSLGNQVEQGAHYELLIRVRDENCRIVEPRVFFSTAERYNLSVKIDRWVIEKAFTWFINHPEQLDGLQTCAINLSGVSIADAQFHEFIINQLEQTGIPPQRICFEITETAAIANLSSAISLISFLKQLGCQFALDDFGSGLSSFAYLRDLPVDFLKIDGIFVKDMIDNQMDLEMVKSINGIGQLMGKKTIAEFVESGATLQKLKEIGVDYAQGHYVGRPRPLEELAYGTDMQSQCRANS